MASGEHEIVVMLYVTCPSAEAAQTLGEQLIGDRVAGCINILGPGTSLFYWQGRLDRAEEWVLLAKTPKARVHACVDTIKRHHPYETPCILSFETHSHNPDYTSWITTNTTY